MNGCVEAGEGLADRDGCRGLRGRQAAEPRPQEPGIRGSQKQGRPEAVRGDLVAVSARLAADEPVEP